MFLSNLFSGLLRYLGLHNKSAKILFLGIDNAGKTTLLHVLRDDRVVQHMPTQHATSEEISLPSGLTLKAFDLGGHKLVRAVWRDFFPRVDGVVFLVDSTNRERMHEAAAELAALLAEPCLAAAPFLILGNKIDLPGAVSEAELRNWLGLPPPAPLKKNAREGHSGGVGSWVKSWRFFGARSGGGGVGVGGVVGGAVGGGERPVELFMCSVIRHVGYGEGLRWLGQHIR